MYFDSNKYYGRKYRLDPRSWKARPQLSGSLLAMLWILRRSSGLPLIGIRYIRPAILALKLYLLPVAVISEMWPFAAPKSDGWPRQHHRYCYVYSLLAIHSFVGVWLLKLDCELPFLAPSVKVLASLRNITSKERKPTFPVTSSSIFSEKADTEPQDDFLESSSFSTSAAIWRRSIPLIDTSVVWFGRKQDTWLLSLGSFGIGVRSETSKYCKADVGKVDERTSDISEGYPGSYRRQNVILWVRRVVLTKIWNFRVPMKMDQVWINLRRPLCVKFEFCPIKS